MRAKDNELGQYAAGCAPRDPIYARLLQDIQKKAKRKAAEAAAADSPSLGPAQA
jgi:hypothetical protein